MLQVLWNIYAEIPILLAISDDFGSDESFSLHILQKNIGDIISIVKRRYH